MTETRKALVVLGAGAVLLLVLWMAAIGPKRAERAEVRDRVSAAEQRLDALRTQLTGYAEARDRFPEALAELRRLDVAVPARGELSALLRGLQRRARARGVQLRLAALDDPGGAPVEDAASAPGEAGTSGAVSSTPGAKQGPAGLAALPFELTFTGEYFELLRLLATVRRAVGVGDDELRVSGRLLTIDGITLERPERDSPVTTATLSATAYVAPTPPAPGAASAAAPAAGPPASAASPPTPTPGA